MIRCVPLLLVLLAAGCGEAPEPEPDPAKVERFLARLDAETQAEAPAAPLPQKAQEKLDKADRLVGSLEKVQPDRIDPDVAATLIAR